MGRFTEKAEKALNSAVEIAEALGHTYIGSEHALLALISDKSSCSAILLSKKGIKYELLAESVKDFSGTGEKTALTAKDTTPRFRKIIEEAYKAAQKFSSERIGTEHILYALLQDRGSTAEKILTSLGYNVGNIKEEVEGFLRTVEKTCRILRQNDSVKISTPTLMRYGKNLTEEARLKECDPVIGREKETERLIRILSRKTKNNPCLIGEAGVGKTAIVEGLAQRIVSNNVPPSLIGKEVILIDLTSMIAGAKYRGDFEDRIKNIIEEIKKNDNVILFIDEVHTIVGAGAAEGAIDAANILKPALARGEIHLIGATTLDEYKRYIESDNALERRFQPLRVYEPTPDEALTILKGLKERYEKYHGIAISDEAIHAAVVLSKRYIKDRYLPDKAIDLLDEACAKASVSKRKTMPKKLPSADVCEEYPELDIILNSDFSLSEKSYKPTLMRRDIEEILYEMTGIPIENSTVSSTDFKSKLEEHIFGQDEAVSAVSDAVTRSMAGLNSEEKPRAIFLFVGESGVGKTELARTLAYVLFGSYDSLIRYDMSEFSEKQSVARFIGSPPGYVGYKESSSVTDKIRQNPYSVVLFDEIEKAHPDVLNLFLQIADTGKLTDSSGKIADFKNTYIVMTSNVYTESKSKNGVGFISTEEKEFDLDSLKSKFSSELLYRLDVVFFKPQNQDSIKLIINKKLSELKATLLKKEIKVDFSEEVFEYIFKRCKNIESSRTIKRVIESEIETPLAKQILAYGRSFEYMITLKEDRLDFLKLEAAIN